MMYACVPELAFRGDNKYACSPMGVYDNLQECVDCIKGLHSSFGCSIYPVETKVTYNLKRAYGMMSGTKTCGYKIIGERIDAYMLPEWSVNE